MNVGELKAALAAYPDDYEVLVTDGFQCQCYRGDFMVELFVDCDGYSFVDIGIGGCAE